MPSSVRSAVWKLLKHCDARTFFLTKRWSCSITLFRYFTRLSLQSFGTTRSAYEALKASGYAAFLSTLIENGRRRCSALIIFLKNRFAAQTSRFALSMNSIVLPSLSTARYRYSHDFQTGGQNGCVAERGAAAGTRFRRVGD